DRADGADARCLREAMDAPRVLAGAIPGRQRGVRAARAQAFPRGKSEARAGNHELLLGGEGLVEVRRDALVRSRRSARSLAGLRGRPALRLATSGKTGRGADLQYWKLIQ